MINRLNSANIVSFKAINKVTLKQDREHSVAVLGTSKVPTDNPDKLRTKEDKIKNQRVKVYNALAEKISEKLAKRSFDIWTGGCPGVAESANRGAFKANNLKSWAIQVQQYIDDRYDELKSKYREFAVKQSGPERTAELIRQCDHAVIFGGGAGSKQELWGFTESKAYKWNPDDVCTNDIILINDNGFYDNDIESLDKIQKWGLGINPETNKDGTHKSMKELVHEVKINSHKMNDKDLDRVSTEIVNHIIDKTNKNSEDKIQCYPAGLFASKPA